MSDNIHIGKQIRKILIEKDKEQNFLAEKLGINHSSVSMMLKKESMQFSKLLEIAKILEVSHQDITDA